MKVRCNPCAGAALALSFAVSCSGGDRAENAAYPPARGHVSVAPAQAPVASGKWVSAYYVGHQRGLYPPEAIRWSGLTHLMIGRVVPRADGTLDTTFDIDPVNGPLLGKRLSELAHKNGKKAVVMLGGAGARDAWVGAASAENAGRLVRGLVKLAMEYGFDGFDLDWEPLTEGDRPRFEALARALRAASPAAILTVPVGFTSESSPAADTFYAGIAPLFNQINIMSYSMAGAWPGWQSWHSSALYGASASTPTSVDTSVKSYLAAGVPAGKLGIGIAFYGTCWSSPVEQPRSSVGGSRIVAEDNVMSFASIMAGYHAQANRRWDDAAKVPYLSFRSPRGPQGCTFVSYEDEQSILEKARYVKERGLGGAIVWTINQGHRRDQPEGRRDPLMDALEQGFIR